MPRVIECDDLQTATFGDCIEGLHRDGFDPREEESLLAAARRLMHAGGAQGWLDQYRFNVERDEISGVLSPGCAETFLRTAVGFGGEEAHDLADHFARRHPSERMRLTALDARAGVLDLAARDDLWRRAEGSGSGLVSREATRRRQALAA